jgi:hypothetical protein
MLMAFVRSSHVFTDSTKLLLPAAFLIVPNSVQLRAGSKIGIIEHFPFSEILYGAFKAQPTEDYL